MDKVILLILTLFIGGVGMSLLLSRFFSRKWVWYIPSIIGLAIIAYVTLKIYSEKMEGHVELGYNIRMLMVATIMTGNLMTNFILGRNRGVIR